LDPQSQTVGTIKRISINNLVAYEADLTPWFHYQRYTRYPIKDVQISNIRPVQQGGGPKDISQRVIPEEDAVSLFDLREATDLLVQDSRGIEDTHRKSLITL
jgi:hypothetical protein